MHRWLVVLVLAFAAPASAQRSAWADALHPRESALGQRLVESAIALIACATEPARCAEAPPAETVIWAQAALRLERAAVLVPEDPTLRLLHALSRDRALGPSPTAPELTEVIDLYLSLREAAPHYAEGHVAYALAILLTRVGRVAEAAREYERVAEVRSLNPTVFSHPLALWEIQLVSLHAAVPAEAIAGNWAEVTMLAGDAERAIELYQQAMDGTPRASFSGALARWGMALAQERAGAHEAAIEMACEAIDVGLPHDVAMLEPSRAATRARWGPFAALHDPDVFFEPRYEIRAYEALGHACLATRSASSEGRRIQLERARASWRFFLLEGGSEGPWAERAESALSTLEGLLTSEP